MTSLCSIVYHYRTIYGSWLRFWLLYSVLLFYMHIVSHVTRFGKFYWISPTGKGEHPAILWLSMTALETLLLVFVVVVVIPCSAHTDHQYCIIGAGPSGMLSMRHLSIQHTDRTSFVECAVWCSPFRFRNLVYMHSRYRCGTIHKIRGRGVFLFNATPRKLLFPVLRPHMSGYSSNYVIIPYSSILFRLFLLDNFTSCVSSAIKSALTFVLFLLFERKDKEVALNISCTPIFVLGHS